MADIRYMQCMEFDLIRVVLMCLSDLLLPYAMEEEVVVLAVHRNSKG